MAQQRLKKFTRDPNYAAHSRNRQITERTLQIIAIIERYRVIPTSLLLRLVGGDPRNAYDHLKHLYQKALVNRFCFFGPTGRPLEFNYFLDNPEALKILIARSEVDPESLDFRSVRLNREKLTPLLDAAAASVRQDASKLLDTNEEAEELSEGKRLFLKHELMISRFHGMLELACRASGGQIKLAAWFQGPILHHYVEAPKITLRNGAWHRQEGTEKLPHQPDALFTLHKTDSTEPLHFFYEADRKTTTAQRMIRKFRAHFHYIAKARQHRQDYSIQRIRAVLIETRNTKWAETLRITAQHPLVSGPKPSELFWLTASQFFTKRIPKETGGTVKKSSRCHITLSIRPSSSHRCGLHRSTPPEHSPVLYSINHLLPQAYDTLRQTPGHLAPGS
jgi:hypothetical protein